MNIDKILGELTLEEKAALCSGMDFWHTQNIERLDIPPVMVSDGPHGLRKMADDGENPNDSIKAVCFPTAAALACSFDRELLETLGKALGEECAAEKVTVILGPGCNIKRSPLCGRNFEYFSEDPYLAGQMAASHIKGVQSKGIGTSLKHFAMNNQETRRMSCSAEVDERTFRELYLAAFEAPVKESKPWTVMCSYNRINGVYSSQNKYLLTDILRDDWGYEGLVMSDWGAVDDRPLGIEAGLDLEMPTSNGKNDVLIVEAVNSGKLSMESLDKCVRRVLELINRAEEADSTAVWDKEKHHQLAAKIAAECAVLLKNDDNILPLDASKKIAFIGEFAQKPRFQGGGSSHINSFKITSALDAVAEYADVTYAQGFITSEDKTDEKFLAEAVEAAKKSDIAVIFAGLPDSFESEGFDRRHMRMPECQLELIRRVREVNENIVIVLHNGSPIEMPFADDAKALLEMYLGGQAVGQAECDLLFGKVSPSGKLAETFPEYLEQNPSYLNFPGQEDTVRYAEGLYVGYKYYEKKRVKPLFPFGHGLSYSSFEYSDLTVSENEIDDSKVLTVMVTVKNTGKVTAKETVQLYVAPVEPVVDRPLKELKGFEKLELKAGESKKAVFKLDKRAFAYYETKISDWYAEDGRYRIMVGASSADIRLSTEVYYTNETPLPMHFDLNSLCGEIKAVPEAAQVFGDIFKKIDIGNGEDEASEAMSQEMIDNMIKDMPLRTLVTFTDVPEITRANIQATLDDLNSLLSKKYEKATSKTI